MQAWWVLAISALYLAMLFAIAWWGDRRTNRIQAGQRRNTVAAVLIYALTLAIYNTSWSFYGSVGRAAAGGLDFLTIYLGPLLVLGPGRRVLTDAIAVAKAQNATSVSDFIAARYGKSGLVAATVTLVALMATLPYIALQLKAIAVSYDVLTGAVEGSGRPDLPFWQDSAFAVAISMALFAILFGVRHVEASERHRGLMLAIAFESLVKLAAFLAVALFIMFGIADGPRDIFARAAADPRLPGLLRPGLDWPAWIMQTVVAALAFLCLPQAFHVAVVENEGPGQVRAARWLYPAYLVSLSVVMLPVALVGLLTFGSHAINPDSFMIALPLHAGSARMGLVTFLGGLSAATGMVIVSAVALSTMVCNDVVMPLLMRLPQFGQHTRVGGVAPVLLRVRRLAVIAVLALAYLTYRLTDRAYPLTLIGLMSFVAVAQFGPGFLGALYWRRATRSGVLSGLGVGFAVWAYTLLLPSVGNGALISDTLLKAGPWGVGWLRPMALFGLNWKDPISHAAFWSLLANCLVFIAISLMQEQSPLERSQARAFVVHGEPGLSPARPWRAVPALSDLQALAVHYVGRERGETALEAYLARRRADGPPIDGSGLADRHAVDFTETLLSGAVGAASARVIIAGSLHGRMLSRSDAMAMLGEASEALGSGRRLLEGALESVGQGICVMDAAFTVAAWNQRFLDLLALPRDLVRVGTPLADIIRFNTSRGEYGADDLNALVVNRDRDALAWPYTYVRERPDGTVLEVLYNRMPSGGYVSTYTDVTERHRAAADLKEANERLEQRVKTRTEDLQQAKAQAEQANAAKTRFLAAASHDLLQPLNAARLFASALREDIVAAAGAVPEGHRQRELELSANLLASLRSTEFLLGDLLDISSLDSGAIKPDERAFAIGPILGELGVEFAALAGERGLTFRIVPSGLTVRSDPRLLRRIVQNLLSNAVRYTRTGGVLLGCRHHADRVRISVYDTGPGIAPEDQAVVFEEFRRLQASDTGAQRGLGLGLAIVDRAARLLGHRVILRSVMGRGTCFSVEVPLQDAALFPVPAPTMPVRDMVAGLRVLCIDNEPAILLGMRALMEPWGCRVTTGRDGKEATAALAGTIPDLVVADYHLGTAEHGLGLIARLRSEWGRQVPSLLLTADRSEVVRQAAMAAGCDILGKPVRPASLRRFLAAVALGEPSDVGGAP
ncbi:MAG TPA: NahK/ErcS family hybrid sensor histidine kinase/response regulator [Aliidongia sp.]|uniref:hybrid sensor histidine kinase/response regulator n=1 Tax=Aliidongia sp. TaxID=1914230 RepID=UPI002DDCF494|nr:NahK/ErcS family hybrid sensor histidine kinase/response regulator [Aliidongia sp.]HEV2677321.1 NahK/ErcS family hybrid sensor histidine kinase/response regulator [Aliidongia sp.]